MENNNIHVELDEDSPKPVLIPKDKISKHTLMALIEAFVLREGTDYGNVEYDLEEKKQQVLKQILSDEVLITFDFVTESPSLMTAKMYQELTRN
ncbi:MAG TPA: YheU family protein [Oligoflexia bacterium]|nr:YheU family protein [Oligoflexia bacterium]HMR24215.1 YheU family protein [Oligoflexia bacterium]